MTSLSSAVIDIHAHFVSPELLSALQREGDRFHVRLQADPDGRQRAIVGDESASLPFFPRLCDPTVRIQEMDAAGISVQALSTWMDIVGYNLDPDAGARFARLQNETLSDLARAHPHRFVAVATVPLQDPFAAAQELHYAVKQLGMRAVQIGTNVNGQNLDSPDLEPFWQAAADLDTLVILHPYHVAGAERMRRYFLSNLVGNPTDTTLAAACLIFGGVLERYPALKVLLVHGGGFLPYQIGRLDRGYLAREDIRGALSGLPSSYFPRFFFDTITQSTASLRFLVDRAGPERVLLGSDFPFFISDPRPVQSVQSLTELGQAERDAIAGGNAARLLGLI